MASSRIVPDATVRTDAPTTSDSGMVVRPYQTNDLWVDANLGLIPKYRPQLVTGINRDIDSGTVPEDIWPVGGLYSFQSAAVSLEVVSSSASDTAAGVGLRQLVVQGLNASYQEISEVVTTNGVTPVPLVQQFLRVNAVFGIAGGSSQTNVGNVDVRVAGGGAIQARIAIGEGRALQWIHTVADGFTFVFTDGFFNLSRAGTSDFVEVQLLFRIFGSSLWVTAQSVTLQNQGTSSIIVTPKVVGPLPARTDLRVTAIHASATNMVMSVSIGALWVS